MNEGATVGPDGNPHSGKGAAGSACGRLLAYFRERSGQEVSGKTMDDDISQLHGDRNASTRKRGVCERIDPRVEWIVCTRRRLGGPSSPLVFFYKHSWTRGRVPFEKPLRAGGLTPESRLAEIRAGVRVPPPRYYQIAIEAGLLPEGFEPPAAPRETSSPSAQPEPKSAPIAEPKVEPQPVGQGCLWAKASLPKIG